MKEWQPCQTAKVPRTKTVAKLSAPRRKALWATKPDFILTKYFETSAEALYPDIPLRA
jgi:hypothetical protein